MENKVFCSKPFQEIYNHPEANYTPCCWASPVSKNNPNTSLPMDHFDGEDFRRLRREMLLGKRTDFLYSYCKYCFDREDEQISSPRKKYNYVDKSILDNFDFDGSLKETKDRFITISINAYGNVCNLECYGCNPTVSTSRKISLDKLQKNIIFNNIDFSDFYFDYDHKCVDINHDINFDDIVNHLVKYADNISTIVIVGGEPMLMKKHFILLDKLIELNKSKNISLSYVSNMTLMNVSNMKKYFENFQRTNIQWSVDALKERNYWLRYPTNWDDTIKNVFEIQSYFKKNKHGSITSTITPSILGIVTLRKTYNWLLVRDLINKNNAITNLVVKPQILRTRNLPEEIKNNISYDIKIISQTHYDDLMHTGNKRQFELAVKYFDLLDQSRGTDWRSTFPEVAKYVN